MNQQTRISDKSLSGLIADEEWWQDFRAAMLELQERRRADSAESVVNTGE